MASAWERKHHHSDLEKVAAFLPSLLAEDSLMSNCHSQAIDGVLLFADMSGGVNREEQPQTRAVLGHSRPFGALPLPLIQSAHPVPAEVPKESGMPYLGWSTAAATSAEPGHGKV